MKKSKILYTILSGAILFMITFSSCDVEDSADVNQDKIYTVYEAFYNSNTDKTWIIARFRFGGPTGTLLELNEPALVTFEGEELPYNPVFLGHYKEFAGRITSGEFVYTNTEEVTFTNSLPASETIQFPAELESISRSNAFSLEWDGTTLKENERVGLFVGSWTWGQDAAFLQINEGASDLVLGKDQLENLPDGQSTFYMDRTTEVDVAEGTSEGGVVRATFRAENINVDITE
ncbi:MAG: hypothetical protein WBA74_20390 [Cyclobacteriaceae bacterium]